GWSLPANAAAGRTRAVTASAVKIHFFITFPFGLGDALLLSLSFLQSGSRITAPAGPNWAHFPIRRVMRPGRRRRLRAGSGRRGPERDRGYGYCTSLCAG